MRRVEDGGPALDSEQMKSLIHEWIDQITDEKILLELYSILKTITRN